MVVDYVVRTGGIKGKVTNLSRAKAQRTLLETRQRFASLREKKAKARD